MSQSQKRQSNTRIKQERLKTITNQYPFIQKYNGEDFYKIRNEFESIGEVKIVLCPVPNGIDEALDIAFELLTKEESKYESNLL